MRQHFVETCETFPRLSHIVTFSNEFPHPYLICSGRDSVSLGCWAEANHIFLASFRGLNLLDAKPSLFGKQLFGTCALFIYTRYLIFFPPD